MCSFKYQLSTSLQVVIVSQLLDDFKKVQSLVPLHSEASLKSEQIFSRHFLSSHLHLEFLLHIS